MEYSRSSSRNSAVTVQRRLLDLPYLIWLGLGVAVAAAAVTGAYWFYANKVATPPDPPGVQSVIPGARVGGAEISPVHANFIVNHGGATATDVLALIERARAKVEDETGIRLETEVRILGEPLAKRKGDQR